MKISIYSPKGGSGKTPLAINFAVDKGYALATNESFDAFSGFFDDDLLLFVAADEEFPEIPSDIDVVFDLAGTMSKNDYSTLSAIQQSDVVIVPIWNNRLSILGGLRAIQSVHAIGRPVIVVATKLTAKTKKKGQNWIESEDYQTVLSAVSSLQDELGYMPAVLPLKYSEVFETVLGECVSVDVVASKSGLAKYTHRELLGQFKDLYQEVEKHG
jgi:cellulose biosynthesis protein BcsQ